MEPSSKKTKIPKLHSNKPNTDPNRLAKRHQFSVESGDLLWLDGHWYVTHSGLIRLARRNQCAGIHVEPVAQFSDPATSGWAFKATVYKSRTCRGFVGYGDADPPMSRLWCAEPKCELPKPGRLTGHFARPTASASARSRKSDPFLEKQSPARSQRGALLSRQTGMGMVAHASATAFASSSASTTSMPPW